MAGFTTKTSEAQLRLAQDVKRMIPIESVVAESVTLRRRGSHLVGLCPFHDDEHASLIVTPAKSGAYGLFNCPACSVGGDVITWVEKTRGFTFSDAVKWLSSIRGLYGQKNSGALGRSNRSSPIELTQAHRRWLLVVASHYRRGLGASTAAQTYLMSRGFRRQEVLERFDVGFSEGSLAAVLPAESTREGHEARDALRELGVLTETDRELFERCVVIPHHDSAGAVVSFSARRIDSTRSGSPRHFTLGHRGLMNRDALKAYSSIVVTEAPLDALSCAEAGLWNVTSLYGTNGFTRELETSIVERCSRVILWLDADAAGRAASSRIASRLRTSGVAEVLQVATPDGLKDANELLVKHGADALRELVEHTTPLRARNATTGGSMTSSSAPKSLDTELPPERSEPTGRRARAIAALEDRGLLENIDRDIEMLGHAGGGTAASADVLESPTPCAGSILAKEDSMSAPLLSARFSVPKSPPQKRTQSLPSTESASSVSGRTDSPNGADCSQDGTALRPPDPRSTRSADVAPEPPALTVEELPGDELRIGAGARTYFVVGLSKQTNLGSLKLMIRVVGADRECRDIVELNSEAQCSRFRRVASERLGLDVGSFSEELDRIVAELRARQRRSVEARAPGGPKKETETFTPQENLQALEFARRKDLLAAIDKMFARAGIVGERLHARLAFLVAVSRLLPNPIALIFRSEYGSGKSVIVRKSMEFTPNEQKESFSRLSPSSLNYMTSLAHKLVGLDEDKSAEEAMTNLKLMLSEGRLRSSSVWRHPATGRLEATDHEVDGPIAALLTSVDPDLDVELTSRCLVVGTDTSREQTRKILEAQRREKTLQGLLQARQRDADARLMRNMQRHLNPMVVVNEYAARLQFPDHLIRARRDNKSYLSLIDAIALLHQHQRPHRQITDVEGETFEAIFVTIEDIAVANELMREVVATSWTGLPEHTVCALTAIRRGVSERCATDGLTLSECAFGQADVIEWTGLSPGQVSVHLAELEKREYLFRRPRQGRRIQYELLPDLFAETAHLNLGLPPEEEVPSPEEATVEPAPSITCSTSASEVVFGGSTVVFGDVLPTFGGISAAAESENSKKSNGLSTSSADHSVKLGTDAPRSTTGDGPGNGVDARPEGTADRPGDLIWPLPALLPLSPLIDLAAPIVTTDGVLVASPANLEPQFPGSERG